MFLSNIWRDNDDNGRDGDNDHALYFYPAYGQIIMFTCDAWESQSNVENWIIKSRVVDFRPDAMTPN